MIKIALIGTAFFEAKTQNGAAETRHGTIQT